MLRIRYKGRETVFEYACEKKDIRGVLQSHFAAWSRDQNGPILVADAIVAYDEEPVDVAAMIR